MPHPVLTHLPEPVTTCVIFASPHSGRVYPDAMTARSRLPERLLRSSEDAYVDLLLAEAPAQGAPLLTTEVPRAYVDFNRDQTELDPLLIDGVGPVAPNPRVAAGLGVIARVVAGGQPIYRSKLSAAEAEDRLTRYWRPYHAALAGLVAAQRARFGQVLLVDVHSMPRAALAGITRPGGRRPEVVLGDRHGAACRPDLLAAVEAVIRAEGLTVARNEPFAGAYVAQAYGRPAEGLNALQIEIDRGLYLDEARIAPAAGFDGFRRVMDRIVAGIAALGREDRLGAGLRMAAE